MIDIQRETVVTPAKATIYCPEHRAGVRPNLATIYRWMQHGVGGIKLESIVVGATPCTSVQALQRFFDRLTAAANAEHDAAIVPPPVSKSRARGHRGSRASARPRCLTPPRPGTAHEKSPASTPNAAGQ